MTDARRERVKHLETRQQQKIEIIANSLAREQKMRKIHCWESWKSLANPHRMYRMMQDWTLLPSVRDVETWSRRELHFSAGREQCINCRHTRARAPDLSRPRASMQILILDFLDFLILVTYNSLSTLFFVFRFLNMLPWMSRQQSSSFSTIPLLSLDFFRSFSYFIPFCGVVCFVRFSTKYLYFWFLQISFSTRF